MVAMLVWEAVCVDWQLTSSRHQTAVVVAPPEVSEAHSSVSLNYWFLNPRGRMHRVLHLYRRRLGCATWACHPRRVRLIGEHREEDCLRYLDHRILHRCCFLPGFPTEPAAPVRWVVSAYLEPGERHRALIRWILVFQSWEQSGRW